MNIVFFIVGAVFGAGIVFLIQYLNKNKLEKERSEFIQNMQLQFENLTNRIFKETSNDFLDKNKEKLDEFFEKFKEKIEDFEKRTERNFKEEIENFSKFDANIKTFIEAGNKISRDTQTLSNVMRSDNRSQGSWGELVLEKVLEASGLRKDEEYFLQKGIGEGRPDATVLLPENRCVYIDAKTSVSSWSNYVNAESEEEKNIYLKEFIESTKKHITGLANRNYCADEKSPDYVLMFVPIESCYSLMFCNNSTLWELAWKNKVMPVSPSTLLAALKIINSFRLIDRQNKNAVEISKICTKMLDKFADMLKDMLDVRKKTDAVLVKLQGKDNILVNIEKLKNLGAVMNKKMPEIENVSVDEVVS